MAKETELPFAHATVVHMLRAAALVSPAAEALVCAEERLDYAGYWRAVAVFAEELRNGERRAPVSRSSWATGSTRRSPAMRRKPQGRNLSR